MSRSVSATATARLKQDYVRLLKDPVPYVRAVPLPSNILVWYYVVTGPTDSPYKDGIYLGKLVFPNEYPFRPPAIYMITPNGRFKTNQKLCLSISDFHPDTWNPAWSVSSILTGLLSFMLENTPTSGSIESSNETKKRLAIESLDFNLKDTTFCELFPELAEEILDQKKKEQEEIEKQRLQNEQNSTSINTTPSSQAVNFIQRNENLGYSFISNFFVILAIGAFAFVVKYVFLNSITS
ncbi:unnamed protein product [Brachionus calyciflorus]|uniref:Ubiquitin-conjugating enzyme E2 J2 n=1 Tax=Brachionus calyciflorus TaxID=104777 RepID=A0A813PRC1_9BILA|nr:unnamed protein product [Brachionus calyciflorus]